jgi:hypothetical protein
VIGLYNMSLVLDTSEDNIEERLNKIGICPTRNWLQSIRNHLTRSASSSAGLNKIVSAYINSDMIATSSGSIPAEINVRSVASCILFTF